MRLYFMADDCPHCPEITKAVLAFNVENPQSPIKIVDVEGTQFGMYEDMLYDIQTVTGEDFSTPTIIFGGCYTTSKDSWITVFEFLQTLHNKEGEHGD